MTARREPAPAPEPLPGIGAIDAHTHLDACGCVTVEDVRAAMDRAEAVGVGRAVTVADDLDSARWVVTATADPRVSAAVALHPTRANALDDAARMEIEKLAASPGVVSVGETGLDYYWPGKLDGCAEPAEQREAFAWHIDLAKRLDKPVMIHDRDAHDDVLAVLRAEGAPAAGVIFHCFSGGPDLARACADAGYHMSFAGTVTFRNARELREAAVLAPEELILVETDAPFLTPHPHRGKANEPYALPYTVRGLAELRATDPEHLAEATRRNATRIFRIP
ncbi:TatD family hydrolase [Pseudonocardia eucalypti]|uniref:TatD family hydrolase n=1 Tax=Pseudonocardia eucalypti TaxID=648755 RepID=A0ABP9PVF1_9PSEU|nr:TatD DNase family protein [Pseudonocardia eucalypti]